MKKFEGSYSREVLMAIEAAKQDGADITYTDTGHVEFDGDWFWQYIADIYTGSRHKFTVIKGEMK